jgi:DNA mismatch repair protein MSH5
MHSHLKGIKNVPRILGIMRTGRAKVSDWQGLVKVGSSFVRHYRTKAFHFQFTFHSAMLRDTLTELQQAANVDIVEKVSPLILKCISLPFVREAPVCVGYSKLQRDRAQSQ